MEVGQQEWQMVQSLVGLPINSRGPSTARSHRYGRGPMNGKGVAGMADGPGNVREPQEWQAVAAGGRRNGWRCQEWRAVPGMVGDPRNGRRSQERQEVQNGRGPRGSSNGRRSWCGRVQEWQGHPGTESGKRNGSGVPGMAEVTEMAGCPRNGRGYQKGQMVQSLAGARGLAGSRKNDRRSLKWQGAPALAPRPRNGRG